MENNIILKKIYKDDWDNMKADAHFAVFREAPVNEKYDFAYLAVDENDCPVHYYTCCVLSYDTVHILFGGAFPDFRGKGKSFAVMGSVIDELSKEYKSILYSCMNDNYAMVKFGIFKKFKIVGSVFKSGRVFLQHLLERE